MHPLLDWGTVWIGVSLAAGVAVGVAASAFTFRALGAAKSLLALAAVWLVLVIALNPDVWEITGLPGWASRGIFISGVATLSGWAIWWLTVEGNRVRKSLWQVRITFGQSKYLTERKKSFVGEVVNSYHDYLTGLGFSPPTKGIHIKVEIAHTAGYSSVDSQSVIGIPREVLTEPFYIAYGYSFSFFGQMINKGARFSLSPDQDFLNRYNAAAILSEYFPLAYCEDRNETPKRKSLSRMLSLLFSARKECGGDFLDGALRGMVRTLNVTDLNPTSSAPFSEFFKNHLLAGLLDMRMVGENDKVEMTLKILRDGNYGEQTSIFGVTQ